jgi:hypothetical protein
VCGERDEEMKLPKAGGQHVRMGLSEPYRSHIPIVRNFRDNYLIDIE